jgi:2-polyprenyl-3-methyl-5-hydroxy-6-metoxy-1,4-benzoquinol methylase
MQYDPIKKSLGAVFNQAPWLRILFYHLLDLLLLRTWHVKKAIRQWDATCGNGACRSDGSCPALTILDAGSGFGQYSYFLSRLKPAMDIDAVDLKEEQIRDCSEFFARIGRKNVSFATEDLTSFIKKEAYDLILSVDVMEHISDDELVFRNFFGSLRPGGMLLISTPSDKGGSGVHDHGTEESFIDEHVRDGYGIDEIRQKLMRAGFTLIEANYTYGRPGQLGWRLSMKYPVAMLNLSKLFFLMLPLYYFLAFPVALICNTLDLWLAHPSGTGLIVKARK